MSETAPAVLPRRAPRMARVGTTVIRRLTEAFAAGDAIHWPAAERLAQTPRDRSVARQLRLVATLAAEADVRRDTAAALPQPGALVLMLLVLAVGQVGVALASAATGAARGVGLPVLAVLLGTALAATIATWSSRVERRTSSLAFVLWLAAAAHARPLLDTIATAGAPFWLRALTGVVCVEAFLPLALWNLARACPPAVRFTRFDVWSRRLSILAVATSLALAASAAWPVLSEAFHLPAGSAAMVPRGSAAFWLVVAAWACAAWATMGLRVRAASRAEATRVVWLVLTVAAVAVPIVVAPVGAVAVACALPWCSAVAIASTGHSGHASGRRWLMSRLRQARPGRDHDAELARVAIAMNRARTPREVAAALGRCVRETLDTPVAAVLARGEAAWTSLDGTTPPLPLDSALAAVLDGADVPLRVDARAPLFALLPATDRTWLASCGIAAIVRLTASDGRTIAGLLVGGPGHRRFKRRDLAFAAAVAATAAMALDACARTGREIGAQAIDDELAFECGRCGRIETGPGVCRCGSPRQLAALPLQLSGKFRLERRIGRGGMGVVYLAVDQFLGRLVALKTLPQLSPHAAHALHAEAQAMAALEHPSVAVVYGLEVWRDTPVLVTEYLSGGTLAARLAQGPLPLRDALRTGIGLAETLADLHARGWLHRDIKPSNIGLARSGTPKLLDFGLTRLFDRAASTATARDAAAADRLADDTRSAPLIGTPLYLSPEALEGLPPAEDVDVWSLAIVVFEMITGAHPYRATTFDDVLQQVRRTESLDVRAWAPATPAAVAVALASALHPDRSRRLGTARAFADALRRALPEACDADH